MDAGKTTLTENLLYEAGIIQNIGRVDNGNTMTDKMALEKKRGISIQSTPISFDYEDIKVNLIDTPGHVEFVAEVERAMSVLDGAVLVISAKEGVQSHTRLLFESLRKLKKPIIFFVNKIDRIGVDIKSLINNIRKDLYPEILELQNVQVGNSINLGTLYNHRSFLEDLLCYDDVMMDDYLSDKEISLESQKNLLCDLMKENMVYPVCYGSALNQIGIKDLLEVITNVLPSKTINPEGDLSGVVFKITRDHQDRRQIFIRLYSGKLVSRGFVGNEKIAFVLEMRNGKLKHVKEGYGHDILVIMGPTKLSVGDVIGQALNYEKVRLASPTFRVKVESSNKRELSTIIDRLAESDPFLEYEIDHHSKDLYLSLFGEIQMEILEAMILEEYGLEVVFSDPVTIFKEMPIASGSCTMDMYKDSPFAATVGLSIEAADELIVESRVPTGHLPQTFQNGILDGIRHSLKEGLKGWEITNAKVSITVGEFDSVSSTPSDYRNLTPMVFFDALDQAKTKLLWPVNKFCIKVQSELVGKVLSDLMRMKAYKVETLEENDEIVLKGLLPVETSYKYEQRFISITSGLGYFSSQFYSYDLAPEDVHKSRPRNSVNPLNKGKYLLSKMRTC